ncbi:EAL domain-containing protein [Desulfogranum japonicum]|uniref:EAL domain-containing protein n=1 Tax=Desulfogranum japonicum TaxID=231447 RepID=UPI0004122FA8|nr:EAL domain-containing protein [Desulfogranum japonicum]
MKIFQSLSVQRIFTLCTEVALLLALLVPACAHFFLPKWPESAKQEQQALNQSADELQRLLETSTTLAAKNALQASDDHIVQAIKVLYTQQQRDALTRDEAQWLAAEILSSQELGIQGSVFAITSKGTMKVHPKKELIGKNFAKDENIKGILKQRDGFIEHSWQTSEKSGQGTVQLAYLSYFKPWDWIIVTSIPVQNRYTLLNPGLIELHLNTLSQNATRQWFILYPEGRLWLSSSNESGTANGHGEEVSTLIEFLQKKKNGYHTYNWLPQNKKKHITKALAFRENECCGTITGVIGVLPHTKPWLALLNHSWIHFTLGTIIFVAGLFLFFRQNLVAPLYNFLDRTETAVDKMSPLSINKTHILEYKKVATHLNTLIAQCIQLKNELQEEQRVSETIHEQLRMELLNRKETHDKLLTEISTRKSAENYLLLFKNIFDYANEGIIITDKEQRILAVNKAFTNITGYKAYEVISNKPNLLKSGQQSEDFYREMWDRLNERGNWSGEICNRRKDGVTYTEWLSISAIKDTADNVTHYFAFFHDITELKNKEQQISFMAYRDALTKLPNRAALETRLTQAISRAKRDKTIVAVFFIDLDNFKNINDSLGHDKGDQVLIQVAQRMLETIRYEDTLSRLGGDEFILLSEYTENESGIFTLASRLLNCLKKPFTLGPSKIYINASIGISTYPEDGSTTHELIKNADMAMYRAKNEGKNKFVMFTREMHEKFLAHIRIENAIRTGLAKREFVIYYQPKLNAKSEQLTSFEALIRWKKGDQIISPGMFIPVAEESGLIDIMSLYSLEEVCRFLRELQEQEIELFPVSVNMAPRTFNNPEVVETIDRILEDNRVDPRYIEFEITETTAMSDVEHTIATMHRFRQRGIHLSIDDFGTGYSSLSYLSEMPVSTLKIDQKFIRSKDTNKKSIVAAIAAMSHQMQLKIVAEGVETRDQLLWLRDLGCDEVQGFYFAQPLSEIQTMQYLTTRPEPDGDYVQIE